MVRKHETATQPNSFSLFKNEQTFYLIFIEIKFTKKSITMKALKGPIIVQMSLKSKKILQHKLVKVSSKLDFHRK